MLEDPDRIHPLGRHLQLHLDEGGSLSFEQVEARPELFVPSEVQRPHYPVDSKVLTVWARFEVDDRSQAPADWVLRVRGIRPELIDLHARGPDGEVYHERNGFAADRSGLPNPERLIRLRLPTEPGGARVYYLRATGRKFGPQLDVMSAERYRSEHRLEDLIVGAYLGLAIAMALYNGFLFWALREVSYAYYVLFIGSFAFYQLDLQSITTEYLSDLPRSVLYLGGSPLLFAEIATMLFIRSFLQSRRRQPRLDWVYRAMLWVAALAAVAGFFGMHGATTLIAVGLGVAFALVVPAGCVASVLDGYRPAWFFLISISVLAIAALVATAGWLSWLPLGFWVDHGVMLGSAVDMVLLSLGLADRMRVLERERNEEAQQAERSRRELLQQQLATASELQGARERHFGELLAGVEHERARVSAQLGNTLGARLDQIGSLLAKIGPAVDGPALRQAREQTELCARETESIVFNVRPQALEGDGFARAVQDLVHGLGDSGAVELQVEIGAEATGALGSEERRLHLFRIIQEGISNALRHASPRRIELRLERSDQDELRLDLRDDGCGFDASEALAKVQTLGLASLTERAARLHGELAIESRPGEGTHLSLSIPVG